MATFICTNSQCSNKGIEIYRSKLVYRYTNEGMICPQKLCDKCGKEMQDTTTFEGYPIKGIWKGEHKV
jgi:hypothetical protein